MKENKNISQAFMDSAEREYQASSTSVLANSWISSEQQNRTVENLRYQVSKVVSPTSTIQNQREEIQEGNCVVQDNGSTAAGLSIIGDRVLVSQEQNVNDSESYQESI